MDDENSDTFHFTQNPTQPTQRSPLSSPHRHYSPLTDPEPEIPDSQSFGTPYTPTPKLPSTLFFNIPMSLTIDALRKFNDACLQAPLPSNKKAEIRTSLYAPLANQITMRTIYQHGPEDTQQWWKIRSEKQSGFDKWVWMPLTAAQLEQIILAPLAVLDTDMTEGTSTFAYILVGRPISLFD
ncbi:hypothetical protein BJ508DRAFT_325798 [Ascobolus immersus RN42]|uniref:Uncharacterized protein n=1 Tax=Ascobolus immersus RN42 TaxID=1160509 RepID=A0A3N4I992_ASCIM|nr:hypothetical protein BJ508DRAFT_325798 [Ascobolus immersus RN42]